MLSRRDKYAAAFVGSIAVLATVGGLLIVVGSQDGLQFNTTITQIGIVALIAAGTIFAISAGIFLLLHGISHGFRYCIRHILIVRKIRSELLDAGIYLKRYLGKDEVAVLPKIQVTFDDNLMTGEVKIQRHLKEGKKLEDFDISSALGRYIVEQSTVSLDGNYYVYDIFDAGFDRQLVFENCAEFTAALEGLDDYTFLVDSITTIPLHHSLISGQTGSGKSFFVQELIWQMLKKQMKYILYFCDPKQDDISRLGNKIAPERTADTPDGIIELLRSIHAHQMERRGQMKQLLAETSQAGNDFKSLNLPPIVVIFDEFLAFSQSLANYDKKTRDEVTSILSDIVLTGRSTGVFLWIVAQATQASNIPTFLRDQMIFRAVMGNSDSSAYLALESSVDIPSMKFNKIGYGVYTYSGKTKKPKIMAAPLIRNFDIFDALSGGV